MDRLCLNQAVLLEIEPLVVWQEPQTVACRLHARHGALSIFEPMVAISGALALRLTTGAPCFLSFKHASGRMALRGVALGNSVSHLIEFLVLDGVKVTDRRASARVPIVTAVRAATLADNGARGRSVDTVTSNLSAGGMLLVRRPGLGDGPRWQIELRLPGDDGAISCEAELARASDTHLGVRLTNILQQDQVRIARLLAGRLRQQTATSAPVATQPALATV